VYTDDVGKIRRVTPSGALTEYPMPTPSLSSAITTGPDGALWFTELTANKIGRVTTSGAFTEFPIPTLGPIPGLGSEPDGITTGPGGAVWFTENLGNKIGRIAVVPASKDQCKNGGWQNFGSTFKDQGRASLSWSEDPSPNQAEHSCSAAALRGLAAGSAEVSVQERDGLVPDVVRVSLAVT
jgi:hypothetical protein